MDGQVPKEEETARLHCQGQQNSRFVHIGKVFFLNHFQGADAYR